MIDITALGEVLIDLTQTGANEFGVPVFAANPGGAPANVAVAASRLGASTAFIGKVGADGFGSYLTGVLQENGVNVSGVKKDEAATTMAIVSVDASGERAFRFVRGADSLLTNEDVDLDIIRNSRFLHCGAVSLTAPPARESTLYAAKKAQEMGVLVSYDPNYRPALWNSWEEASEWIKKPLPFTDVLKISAEELPLVADTDDLEQGSAALCQMGIPLVLVTLGSEGAFYRLGQGTGRIPGIQTKVADTNGAGDTFFGAVLRCLCKRSDGPMENLSVQELEEILMLANRAASLTCSRSGAIPAMPTAAELL